MDVRVGLWRKLSTEVLMLLNCGVGEDSWETTRRSNQAILKEISPGCSLEGMMLKLNSSTLATSCEELTHWKRLWCWEGLGAGGEADDRGWDGWMASLTRWTWVWVNSGSRWCTGRPGVPRFMGSQRIGHDWATELTLKKNNLKKKIFIGIQKYPASSRQNSQSLALNQKLSGMQK